MDATDVKILGARGGLDFMIDAGTGDALNQFGVPLARVYSLADGRLGDPIPVTSLAARGYWEAPDTVAEPVLARVRELVAAL